MSDDPIAERVAARFRRGADSRDALLGRLEKLDERNRNFALLIQQGQARYSQAMSGGKPHHEVETLCKRLEADVKTYLSGLAESSRLYAEIEEIEEHGGA